MVFTPPPKKKKKFKKMEILKAKLTLKSNIYGHTNIDLIFYNTDSQDNKVQCYNVLEI